MKLLIQFVQPFACVQPRLGPGQHVAQTVEVFVGRARGCKFGGLDLVDLAHLDRFEDLAVFKRQAEAGKERHRLDPADPAVDIDAGFRPPFNDLHSLKDRQRLSQLAPADREMRRQIAFRRGLAVVHPRRFDQIGGDGRKDGFLLHAGLRLRQDFA